jgi:hypothetical protein
MNFLFYWRIDPAEISSVSPELPRLAFSRTCDFFDKAEKATLALAADAPIDRQALITFVVTLSLFPAVVVSPGSVFADCGDEVIHRLVEIEMVIFGEQNRLRP